MDQAEAVPGLVRAEDLTMSRMGELCARIAKPSYTHDEVFGEYCFLAEHIDVPYDDVFEYLADPRRLVEWTINIRDLVPLRGGVYRGVMVFSSEPTEKPTEIFIRADAVRGTEQGLVTYPCAWDQGDDLWMRYYFVVTDATKTLHRRGTVVLWTNCKHPFYDRATRDVPAYVDEGRARTDRPWAGDAWPAFYPAHRLELSNLKKVLEHRYQHR